MTDLQNGNSAVKVRKATADDIDLLVKLRVDFFIEQGKLTQPGEAEAVAEKLRSYFEKHIRTDAFVAIIAERAGDAGTAVSTAFLSSAERPPRRPDAPNLAGTVYNVYTYPEHRGNGYAAMVMRTLLEEAKSLGIGSVDLLATAAGKPLYEKLGFEISTYTPMRMEL